MFQLKSKVFKNNKLIITNKELEYLKIYKKIFEIFTRVIKKNQIEKY